MKEAVSISNDLMELCKPIQEYLKEKHHPRLSIDISLDGVEVKEVIELFPLKSDVEIENEALKAYIQGLHAGGISR